MEKRNFAIAIDGPAAAGKSTVAKIVAKKLSFLYIDTGAMYRAITLKALKNGINVNNEDALLQLLMRTKIDFLQIDSEQKVLLDDIDVTEEIRSQEVTKQVSYVAKHPKVRKEMVARQREMARHKGVVMDGRDIGSQVLPDAEVKIFLVASVEERAKRRYEENKRRGIPSDMEELIKEIALRDRIDSEREASPLIKADGAIEIDTTSMTIQEVADRILNIAKKQL
ncbi:cytidylate kinase [Compostibacillus humi]|uniref:Cytidylate kinase n=1 Tax=Compostibacillus humi TaxID=1245525 RepID=A0A8J3EIT2_9BACI|nr:(d)CMP kinase [Compostibacillus humi]GGH68909.1 cytidylate kinase [Compostibacillus humi]